MKSHRSDHKKLDAKVRYAAVIVSIRDACQQHMRRDVCDVCACVIRSQSCHRVVRLHAISWAGGKTH